MRLEGGFPGTFLFLQDATAVLLGIPLHVSEEVSRILDSTVDRLRIDFQSLREPRQSASARR